MNRFSLDRESLDRLDMFVKHVENILNRLDSIKEQLNRNNLLYKLVEALTLHKSYVLNLKKFLSGEIDWNPPTHTQCNFGKIYYSIDPNYINNTYGEGVTSAFKRIGIIHMKFHEIAEEYLNVQNLYEFKMLIVELASKSTLLVETMFELLETISVNHNINDLR